MAAAAPSSKPSIPKVVTLPNKPPVEALKPSPSLLLPPPDPQGKYSVHVGSFKIKDNALILVKKLKDKGYPVLWGLVKIPEKGSWYRVRVGYYSSLKDTKEVASILASEEKVPTLILKRK